MSIRLADGEAIAAGSPAWLENKIVGLNGALFCRFEKIGRQNYLLFVLLVSVFATAALVYLRNFPQPILSSIALPPFFRDYPKYILAFPIFLLALGPILLGLEKTNRTLSTFVVAVISILFFYFQNTLLAYAPTLLAYAVCVVAVFATSTRRPSIRIGALLVTVLICLFAGSFLFAAPVIVFFLRSLSFGIVEQGATETEFSFRNRLSLQYVVSPLTFFFMMPLRIVEFEQAAIEVRKSNVLQGFVDILIGLLAFALCSVFFSLTKEFAFAGPLNLLGGIRMSLGYFLCSWGFFRLACGSGRWLGLTLSDGSHFAILATSPMESWKRWSLYLYDWMRAAIFIPIFRRTNISLIAFLGSFSILFLLHFADYLPSMIFPHGSAETLSSQRQWVLKNSIYFLSLGLLVYGASGFAKYWPSAKRNSGWIGIVVVQVLLGICHLVLL